MLRKVNLLGVLVLLVTMPAWAQQRAPDSAKTEQSGNRGIITSSTTTTPQNVAAQPPAVSTVSEEQANITPAQILASNNEIKYKLGPDDLILITVERHPEFSGTFPINSEGKIQIPYVGDIDVTGYTKKELAERLKKLLSGYLVNPGVNVTILDYRSKFYLVIGEVNRPGKYYMRSESTTVKDAIVEAGLPMVSAAMRKCRLITPDKYGRVKTRGVDVYAILYGGNLRQNIEVHPGDTLYVPATVMAKVFRVIAPVSDPVVSAAGASSGAQILRRPASTAPHPDYYDR